MKVRIVKWLIENERPISAAVVIIAALALFSQLDGVPL